MTLNAQSDRGAANRAMLREAVAWALVAALALAPIWALALYADWPTHEDHAYANRLAALVDAQTRGQWLGRWCYGLERGYGLPLFWYYAPGFYLLASVAYHAGLGISASIRLTLALLQLAGVAGVYAAGRQFYGRAGAALCSGLWAFAPYQLTNLFVRGAFAEFAALQWLAISLALYLAGARRASLTLRLGGALAQTALIVTHAITALCATPLIFAAVCYGEWRWNPHSGTLGLRPWLRRWARVLAPGAIGGALAIAGSAFYWLPAMTDGDLVRLGGLTSGYWTPAVHFIEPAQWFDVLRWGYGPSVAGPLDGMPMHLGFAPLFFLGIAWWRKTATRAPSDRNNSLLIAATAAAGACLFLTTPYSNFVWRAIPLLSYVQFPWRFLGEAALCIALAGGAAIEPVLRRESSQRRRALWAIGALAILYVAPPWGAGPRLWQLPSIGQRPTVQDLTSRKWPVTTVDEYLPIGAREPDRLPYTPLKMTEASGNRVVFGQYWFPGWRVERGGIEAAPVGMGAEGLVEFAGNGAARYRVYRVRTTTQWIGDAASALAMAGCLVFLVFSPVARRRWRSYRAQDPIGK